MHRTQGCSVPRAAGVLKQLVAWQLQPSRLTVTVIQPPQQHVLQPPASIDEGPEPEPMDIVPVEFPPKPVDVVAPSSLPAATSECISSIVQAGAFAEKGHFVSALDLTSSDMNTLAVLSDLGILSTSTDTFGEHVIALNLNKVNIY